MSDAQLHSMLGLVRRTLEAPFQGVPDFELLRRFTSERDEAAFELLVWRHGKMVMGVCQRVLRESHEAEDAFQASFLVLARRANSIRGSLGGWLQRVAFRIALRAKTQRDRRLAREQQEAKTASLAGGSQPATRLISQERDDIVDEEVDRLPEKLRVPLVLSYFEGRSNEEIALEVNCPLGTVASRLARARAYLRQRLTRRGVAPASALLVSLFDQGLAQAVPRSLVASASQTAMLVVNGQWAAAGAISGRAVALMQGVLQAMFISKLKAVGCVLAPVVLLACGAGVLVHRSLAGAAPTPQAEQTIAADGIKKDEARKNDEAAIAKLVEALGSNRFAERDSASKQLERIGAAALPALRKAARSDIAEVAQRAQALATRIEDAVLQKNTMAATPVHLVLKDTAVETAVEELRRLSGYNIGLIPSKSLSGRRVTLDTGDVGFWQAYDLLCGAAGLDEGGAAFVTVQGGPIKYLPGRRDAKWGATPDLGRLQLRSRKPKTAPTAYLGALRVRAGPGTRTFSTQATVTGEMTIALEICPEPKIEWRTLPEVRIDKIVDDQGQTLEVLEATADSAQALPHHRYVTIRVVEGAKPAKMLRELHGVISANVLAGPEPTITIDNLAKAKGKTYEATTGGKVTIIDSGNKDGQTWARFEWDGSVEDPNVIINGNQIKGSQVERPWVGLAVLDAKGKIVPDAKLDINKGTNDKTTYTLEFAARDEIGPMRVVFLGRKKTNIHVSFALTHVPLP